MDRTHNQYPRGNLPRPYQMFNAFPGSGAGPFPADQGAGPQPIQALQASTDTARSAVSSIAPGPGGSTMLDSPERLPSLRSAFGHLATGNLNQYGPSSGQSTDPSSSAWSLLRTDQIPPVPSSGGQSHGEHTFPSHPPSTSINTTMEQLYSASSASMQSSATAPHGFINPHPAPPWFLNPFLHPVPSQSSRRPQPPHGRNRSSRVITSSQGPPPHRPPPQVPASTNNSNSASHRHAHATTAATSSNTRRRSVRVIRDGRAMAELLPFAHADLVRSRGTMSREQFERDVQILRGAIRTHSVASGAALRSLQSVDVKDLPEDERWCMICYNKYGEESPEGTNEAPLRLPHCKHVFGDHCLKRWLGESDHCPYCRDKLPSTVRPCGALGSEYLQLIRAREYVLSSEHRRTHQDASESATSPSDSDEVDAYSSDNQASSSSLPHPAPPTRGGRRPHPEDSENSLRRTRVRLSEDGSYSGRGSSRSSHRAIPPQHSSTHMTSSEGGVETGVAGQDFASQYNEASRYINGTHATGAAAPYRSRPEFQVAAAMGGSMGLASASNFQPNPIQENMPASRYPQSSARNTARRYLPMYPNRTYPRADLVAAIGHDNYNRVSAGVGMGEAGTSEQAGAASSEPEHSDL